MKHIKNYPYTGFVQVCEACGTFKILEAPSPRFITEGSSAVYKETSVICMDGACRHKHRGTKYLSNPDEVKKSKREFRNIFIVATIIALLFVGTILSMAGIWSI